MYEPTFQTCVKEKKTQKGETDMNINPTTEVLGQKSYLQGELYKATHAHVNSLELKYGLKDVNPKNAKEAIQMIKDGKIVLLDDMPEWSWWHSSIRFRDPNLKEDKEGFKAAEVFLRKAANDVERIITIKTPEEGLKAVIDFEEKTFD